MVTYDAQGESGRYFYHYDGQGNVLALSDGTGNVVEMYSYDVYGQFTIHIAAGPDTDWLTNDDTLAVPADVSTVGNPYFFTGRRYDAETGLYYYRARMVSPDLGRFLQTDPIGYADGMNMYAYCANNPVNWIDPWGLCSKFTTPSAGDIDVACGYDPLRTVYEMQLYDVFRWFLVVRAGGERDYKTHGHTGNNEITHPEWEDWGNFDYGVSGSAIGLPPWLLHWGARMAGGGSDEPRDTLMINQGIEWYEQHGDEFESFDWFNDSYWEF